MKYFTLIRHLLEAEKEASLTHETTEFLLYTAKNLRNDFKAKYTDWCKILISAELKYELDLVLDQICCIIDIFGNLATFKDDEFKIILVSEGQFKFANEFMYDLKLVIDELEKLGLFSQFGLKTEKS